MERMTESKIRSIGEYLFKNGDVIAKHGTSIENAISIMETGFNFHRSSFVMQKSKNVSDLCSYGWKYNEKGNAANVIIEIPSSFCKNLLGYNDEKYNNWIENLTRKDLTEELLLSASEICIEGEGPAFNANLPREFIAGTFVFTDNKNYLDFLDNPEESLKHLTYIDNPNSYSNLSEEDKANFVNHMRENILGRQEDRKI